MFTLLYSGMFHIQVNRWWDQTYKCYLIKKTGPSKNMVNTYSERMGTKISCLFVNRNDLSFLLSSVTSHLCVSCDTRQCHTEVTCLTFICLLVGKKTVSPFGGTMEENWQSYQSSDLKYKMIAYIVLFFKICS